MPRTSPLILVFEQHSFSCASQVAQKLIDEQWCQIVGFELPYSWKIEDLNEFYNNKMMTSGIQDEKFAEIALAKALENQTDVQTLLRVRSYFSAKERLKLIKSIKDNDAVAMGLDIALEERNQIKNHSSDRSAREQFAIMTNLREDRILQSIMQSPDKSMVCVIGLQHASRIISSLISKKIHFHSCFIWESWAPKNMIETINAAYLPKKRSDDGILEFNCIDSAMRKLRELLLPYSMKSSKRLDEPTILTRQLAHKSGLSFFSIDSDRHQVIAITEISNSNDLKKADEIHKALDNGNFFFSDNKRYFGLSCINMPECDNLPKKILELK